MLRVHRWILGNVLEQNPVNGRVDVGRLLTVQVGKNHHAFQVDGHQFCSPPIGGLFDAFFCQVVADAVAPPPVMVVKCASATGGFDKSSDAAGFQSIFQVVGVRESALCSAGCHPDGEVVAVLVTAVCSWLHSGKSWYSRGVISSRTGSKMGWGLDIEVVPQCPHR